LPLLVDLDVVEVPLLYPGVGLQIVLRQRLIYLLRELHAPVVIAGFHKQEEEVKLRPLYVLGFEVGDHLEYLDESEVLLSLVLHPEGAAPDVDPGNIDVGAHGPTDLRDRDLVPSEHGTLAGCHTTFRPILSLILTLQVLG
jgi:hypothetical protein